MYVEKRMSLAVSKAVAFNQLTSLCIQVKIGGAGLNEKTRLLLYLHYEALRKSVIYQCWAPTNCKKWIQISS
ncbi:hypothetical protein JOC77_001933 [Peribacillus deserti]|uniref:Uncharacterized protein n=1 Tax=Peribacillus deserti TaxID=673318 RepID=A0ABS2QH91_9BACI|nr:hypothetical protein [Peribacillus deserti]